MSANQQTQVAQPPRYHPLVLSHQLAQGSQTCLLFNFFPPVQLS